MFFKEEEETEDGMFLTIVLIFLLLVNGLYPRLFCNLIGYSSGRYPRLFCNLIGYNGPKRYFLQFVI